jgi:hypothetical protein
MQYDYLRWFYVLKTWILRYMVFDHFDIIIHFDNECSTMKLFISSQGMFLSNYQELEKTVVQVKVTNLSLCTGITDELNPILQTNYEITANEFLVWRWSKHAPKKTTLSEFICGRWYSSTGDDLKNAFSRSTIQFFLLYNSSFLWLKVTNNK